MEILNEFPQFLNIDSRYDVKDTAIQYLIGLTGDKDNIINIVKNKEIITKIILLLVDKEEIIKNVVLFLINISAEEIGVDALMSDKFDNSSFDYREYLISKLVDIILNQNSKVSDSACMLLCNMSRSETHLKQFVDVIFSKLPLIIGAFTNISFNKNGGNLHYLGPLFCNLSGDSQVRQWLCNEKSKMSDALKIASFCQFEESVLRRSGAVGTLRNLCFDIELHDYLLNSEINILVYLLLPLAGGEEFDDEEMSTLPISLQYLPKEKQRERDPEIRKSLLESLNKLCVRKSGREFLRDSGTYYILRELHKVEKDKKVLLACENVVDILIRKEDEMLYEDISAVDVPEKYHEQFVKMDNDFLNDQ